MMKVLRNIQEKKTSYITATAGKPPTVILLFRRKFVDHKGKLRSKYVPGYDLLTVYIIQYLICVKRELCWFHFKLLWFAVCGYVDVPMNGCRRKLSGEKKQKMYVKQSESAFTFKQ